MRSEALLPLAILVLVLISWAPRVAADDEAPPAKEVVPILFVVEGTAPLYLFGTTTLPDRRLFDLHPAVEQAIERSDVYVSEAPLDLPSQMKAQSAMRLPGGKTLASVVGDDVYARVKAVIPSAMPEMLYRQFSPFAAVSIIELREYIKDVIRGVFPVELRLHSRFKKAGKQVSALETTEEQAAIFSLLSLEEQAKYLETVLQRVEGEIERDESAARTLVAWYLAGDYEKMTTFAHGTKTGDADLDARMERLLADERLARMVERLATMRKDAPNDVHFVALGASHFGGEQGLLKRFEKLGWKVRRVRSVADLPPVPESAASDR